MLGGKGENLEFEKLSHFLNLLDFQLLSQQVLSRAVGYFLCKNCTPHPPSLSHQTPLKIKVLCQALFYFKIWQEVEPIPQAERGVGYKLCIRDIKIQW